MSSRTKSVRGVSVPAGAVCMTFKGVFQGVSNTYLRYPTRGGVRLLALNREGDAVNVLSG